MQASLYRNPMFATGLASVLQSFVGNPRDAALAELYASEAGLNNDTRRYREQIGEAGIANNLADMLVRSLQAGKAYSSEAPEIAEAMMALPQPGLADMLAPAMMPQPAAPARPALLREMEPDETVVGSLAPMLAAPPPARPAAAAAATAGNPNAAVLAEARAAIAAGAPREAVLARLAEMGIDPTGL